MSYSPNSRVYRPMRSRRLSNSNQPEMVKRYKADEPMGLMGSTPSFEHVDSDRMDSSNERYLGAEHENNVLLFTVINAAYPITVDVMKAICSPFGRVLRIVVFRKNGVQALVEFDNIDTARHAKDKLQGADIYSGCCTLKVDYAKSRRLNVLRNDADNYDCELCDAEPSDRKPLLRTPATSHPADSPGGNVPPSASGGAPYQSGSSPAGGAPRMMDSSPRMPRQEYRTPAPEARPYVSHVPSQYRDQPYESSQPSSYSPHYGRQQRHEGPGPGGPGYHPGPSRTPSMSHYPRGGSSNYQRMDSPYPGMHAGRGGMGGGHPFGGPGHAAMHGGSMNGPMMAPAVVPYSDQGVLLVNNLNPNKMNCDLLFNFLCVYGNVHRIKFLRSREGCAMVQMDQMEALSVFLRHINNTYVFGNKISISFSKQEQLEPVMRPYALPDGSPSYMDYMQSRNNRYLDERSAAKNRPVAPSNTLYYFNTPPDYTEEDVCKIFDTVGAMRPLRIKNFASRRSTEDSRSRVKGVTGLAEWNNIADAADALVLSNNHEITHQSSRWPYIFKLTFSSAPVPSGSFNPAQMPGPDSSHQQCQEGEVSGQEGWNASGDMGQQSERSWRQDDGKSPMRRQASSSRGSTRWNRSSSPRSSSAADNHGERQGYDGGEMGRDQGGAGPYQSDPNKMGDDSCRQGGNAHQMGYSERQSGSPSSTKQEPNKQPETGSAEEAGVRG